MLVADALIDGQKLLLNTAEKHALTGDARRITVSNIQEVQEYERQHLDDCVDSSFAAIEAGSGLIIIESFNDSVWPWPSLDRVDVAVAVGPGHVFRFDPEKIRRAVDYSMDKEVGARALTFYGLSDLVKPTQRYEFKAEVGLDHGALSDITRTIK
jgi:predicted P-loop ATPase/GTPase